MDENGAEVRTQKGRGRPRKGYAEVEPGVWKLSEGAQAAPKEKKSYVYVRFDNDGKEIERRPVKRGRGPKGFVKCEVMPGGSISDAAPTDTTVDCAVMTADSEDGMTEEDSNEDDDESNEPNEPKYPEPVVAGRTTKDSGSRCSIHELIKCIKPLETHRVGNVISLACCDIIGHPSIEYLSFNQVISRIDIHTDTGDVHVWKTLYVEGHPDVVIPRGVEILTD